MGLPQHPQGPILALICTLVGLGSAEESVVGDVAMERNVTSISRSFGREVGEAKFLIEYFSGIGV